MYVWQKGNDLLKELNVKYGLVVKHKLLLKSILQFEPYIYKQF